MQRRVLYVILGALSGSLLFGSFAELGMAAVVLNLMTPLPAAYIAMRFGAAVGWMTVALTALVLVSAGSAGGALLYLIQFGLPAGVLVTLMTRGWGWDRAALVAVGTMLAAGLAGLVGQAAVQATDPLSLVGVVIDQEINQASEVMRQVFSTANLPESEQTEISEALLQMSSFMRDVYAGLAVVVGMYMLLAQVLLLSLLGRSHFTLPGKPFAQWKAPEPLIWLMILGGFGVFLADGLWQVAAMNVLVIIVPIYFLQGLAIIDSFFRRKAFTPLFRTIGYLLVLLVNPLPLMVACLGVFDLWIDFRKPRIPKSS
ncbi:MAG: hypothetical protein C0614_07690 [Desulfuromonas sp.]|nr:MAG: hypothetical protein C0614_07690 [Desulfuromonas sp.]